MGTGGALMPHVLRTDQMTRAGLNLIQQALSIYDAGLKLSVCNRPFQTMFDLPEQLVTPGAGFEDTIRFLVMRGEYGEVDDPEAFIREKVDQALAFEPHYVERQRANGRFISVEGSPLPEGGWVTVYTDITAIKRQEGLLRARSEELSDQVLSHTEELARANRQLAATNAQLEEAKRELTEMEARIRLTTEMTPAHIAHVDGDGIYTYTNKRLSSLLPGRQSDITGLSFEEALGAGVAELLRPSLAKALAGEASVHEFTEPEAGRRIRTAFTPDRTGKDGQIAGCYLLSTDVTEEAQARAALGQTHKRELAARLTSGLAHDFANLLTVILGLQGRLEKLPMPLGAHELTGATKAAARRGGDLLSKIARLTSPKDMQQSPTVVEDFLANLLPLARATLPDGITLKVDNHVPHPALMLDTGSLQDSLLNLTLNARDAIGEGRGEIFIRFDAVRDTWLEITVTDTGRGFTEEALKQALDPFFTTKGKEGSGLGLSMVYDLTKSSGGHVRLSNGEAGGAIVTLRLPLKPARAEARPRLVLVVEDQPEIRVTLRDHLTGLGHQVIEAASAEEALTLTDIPGIDWVLSDINLGAEDGVSLLGQIADRHPTLRLALMTSLPENDPRRTTGAARWPVLQKPVNTGALHALLHAEAAA